MVQRNGGMRRKTRGKMSKPHSSRGKISIRRSLHQFKEGDRVTLSAEPAVQTGMYLPRFHGKSGIVEGSQGECYVVRIKDGNKAKQLIIHPVHLRSS